MAMSLLSGVQALVYRNDEKGHFWIQVIAILEPIETESHTIP